MEHDGVFKFAPILKKKLTIPKDAIHTNYRIIPQCQRVYDEKTKKWRDATFYELGSCCVNICNERTELCKKDCAKINYSSPYLKQECNNECEILNSNLCRKFCRLTSGQFITYKTAFDCAKQINCLDVQGLPEINCVTKNKDSFKKCLEPYCKKLNVRDCDVYLDFLSTLPFKPAQYQFNIEDEEKIWTKNEIKENYTDTKSKNNSPIIFFFIIQLILIIIIIGIIIYICMST